MQNLFRNAAYGLLLIVVGVYAAGAIAVVALLFVVATVLDAVFAGWTRTRAQRFARIDLLEAPPLLRR